MAQETPPTTTTVEWGARDGRGRLGALVIGRWHRRWVWVLAGLGGLAMAGSLVSPWQVLNAEAVFGVGSPQSAVALGAGQVAGWGAWWIFAVSVLATLVALTVIGQPALAAHTRTIGLAACPAVAVVLVAATISLAGESQMGFFPSGVEHTIGQGMYLAYAALILFGAAVWLAVPAGAGGAGRDGTGVGDPGRVRGPSAPGSGGGRENLAYEGPRDLSVEPATPDTLQG